MFYCFLCSIVFTINAQSELYVLNKELPLPEIKTCSNIYPYDGKNAVFLDYYYDYGKGKYKINKSLPLTLKISCQAEYDSCPDETNCGGSLCCQERINRDVLKTSLGLFGEIILDEGNSISCDRFENADPELNYYAVLLPKINVPNGKICEREAIFARYSDGLNHNVNGLVWEYYSNSGWKEIPNHKNRYPLNVSLLDVFGTSWQSQFSGNLQLRFKFTAPFTNDVIYSLNNYTISLTTCSPEFSAINPIKTKCNYSDDGSFKLKLKRTLDTNENLVMTLYYEYDTGYDLAANPQESTFNLFNESDGTYSYTWVGHLPAGNYKLKYQTKLGNGGIVSSDPTWATLSEHLFTIGKAKKVAYFAEKINDESCYAVKDGKIRLYNVTSEGNRTFSYIVYEVQGTNTLTVLKNWTSFSGNNVVVDQLKRTKLRVKLKDDQGCFAKGI